MLKHSGKWTPNSTLLFPNTTKFSCRQSAPTPSACTSSSLHLFLKIKIKRAFTTPCRARRRAIYEDDEERGYNEELAMLEMYSQLVRDEILLVHAMVDDEKVEVLIFKGFSSCLSYKTFSNPSRSVLPAKAMIQNIDRAKAPFHPSNIQYIEKGLSFDAFKTRLPRQN
ncbi:hypothetical protein ACS0TY_011369 [Phlomoides rotata]